ncbi:MAG: Twitching motility protein [Candidatus Magasanikbacteria bacterium]|nr:Twitching motility protein [Candidatus Magasanikbacteria bacterium]
MTFLIGEHVICILLSRTDRQPITAYLNFALKKKASDLHLVGGEVPLIRIEGRLMEIEKKPLADSELRAAIKQLVRKELWDKFQETHEMDFGHESKDARFRINLHQQDGKAGLAARVIPKKIPTPKELHFAPVMNELVNLKDGLILVTGPAGCGKSTAIASMIEQINLTRKAHIITIEDPIEFAFEDKKCLIEQREVGADTATFHTALKYVLRQDPNVIVVGEMRDPETIAATLTAAETGHLVFSTLHTPSAAESIERIIDVFEGPKQKQVLVQLSGTLRAVISQELLPATNGNRIAAREILTNTPAIANLIRENKIQQIQSAIQTGGKEGMITMEKAIMELVDEGLVSREIAERRLGKGEHKRKYVV